MLIHICKVTLWFIKQDKIQLAVKNVSISIKKREHIILFLQTLEQYHQVCKVTLWDINILALKKEREIAEKKVLLTL